MKNKFVKVIGTGGIGTGVVYLLEGDKTLGRDESRGGSLLKSRDFCKGHIILHYVSVLSKQLGLKAGVYPVGAVGGDSSGNDLLKLMRSYGLKTKYVKSLPNKPTLYSVCFQYPDRSGGNITENRSASDAVSSSFIKSSEEEFKSAKGRVMVLAAPEVPFASRKTILKLGRKYGAFNCAAFLSEELGRCKKEKIFKDIDLIALNIDEAATLAGVPAKTSPDKIVELCVKSLTKDNPMIMISITNGGNGSYGYFDGVTEFLPSQKVKIKNTAGAGDASLGAIMAGVLKGLPFLGKGDSCIKLGRKVSSLSVKSEDTINFSLKL